MGVGHMTRRMKLAANIPETPEELKANRSWFTKRSKILQWDPARRSIFDRELLSRSLTVRELSAKYQITPNCIQKYKRDILGVAVRAAVKVQKDERTDAARQHMDWIFDNVKDSVERIKGIKVDEETGKRLPKEKVGIHGNVVALLGMGVRAVEIIGKMTGELADAPVTAQGESKQIINVISLPKIEGTPSYGKRIEGSTNYDNLKLIDVEAESSE